MALTFILIIGCTQNELIKDEISVIDYYSINGNTTKKEVLHKAEMPIQPVFQTRLPIFPAIVLHILQREYAHQFEKGKTSLNQGKYIEKRLIELYPEKAYKGMYEQAKDEMDKNIDNYKKYLSDLKAYEKANGIESTFREEDNYQKFSTLEAEIQYMQMTKAEIEEFNKYEVIATSDIPVTRRELDTMIQSRSPVILAAVIVTAAVLAGYSVWRVLQSRNRAENKTDEFYPGASSSGEKGDAFRHIYVSVLLRRYITLIGAWTVMSGYETLHPNDHARDTQMDYHNNAVGRYYEYWTFRGSYWGDRYKWEKWADNARYWVDDSYNGVDMEEEYGWLSDDPDADTADDDENEVNNHKYIYYAH